MFLSFNTRKYVLVPIDHLMTRNLNVPPGGPDCHTPEVGTEVSDSSTFFEGFSWINQMLISDRHISHAGSSSDRQTFLRIRHSAAGWVLMLVLLFDANLIMLMF